MTPPAAHDACRARRWAALALLAAAGAPGAGAAAAGREVADMDITELVNVRVSPVELSSQLDRGYRASNSVSARASMRNVDEMFATLARWVRPERVRG